MQKFTDPSGVSAWKTIPAWDVIGLDDHIIPAAGQLSIAQHANATSPRSTRLLRSRPRPVTAPPGSSACGCSP